MQECSQLYYNYTILLLNFRRSYRGSTDRSRSLLSRAWNCHRISRSPTTSVDKSRLAFSSLDCRIHSFTFAFFICVLRLNNGLVEYALASRSSSVSTNLADLCTKQIRYFFEYLPTISTLTRTVLLYLWQCCAMDYSHQFPWKSFRSL